jgi:hypothetical protein
MSGTSWTQPMCLRCYTREYPGRTPVLAIDRETEWCCLCGRETNDGIYVRRDPRTVVPPKVTE